jgi:hypothetical protein
MSRQFYLTKYSHDYPWLRRDAASTRCTPYYKCVGGPSGGWIFSRVKHQQESVGSRKSGPKSLQITNLDNANEPPNVHPCTPTDHANEPPNVHPRTPTPYWSPLLRVKRACMCGGLKISAWRGHGAKNGCGSTTVCPMKSTACSRSPEFALR